MPAPRAVPCSLVVATVALAAACDPFDTQFADREQAVLYRAERLIAAPRPADQVVVMTWNVKFGGGRIDFFFDCHGDAVLMDEGDVRRNLDRLAAAIVAVDPDIVLLQEVDVLSKRSAYVDQVQYLLDHTALDFGAYASQWKADFVPSDGLGRVDSGNAILSKWPFAEAVRIALPEIGDQDAATRYFWLKRNILRTRVRIPERGELYVVATHTAAFAKDGTKKEHIDRFKAELDAIDAGGGRFVAGGDLNALPPGTAQTRDFADSACEGGDFDADDYSAETDWMTPLYDAYPAAIPLADYEADNTPHFSHTTAKDGFWNRKLDYLFTNGTFASGSGLVRQGAQAGGMETMPLSDHAPVTVTLELLR